MKKTIILVLVAMSILSSCKKDKPCNCGTITDDGVTTDVNGNNCYWLEIRNECSDNKKRWCFDGDIWLDANIGEEFCVTNEPSW